MKYVIYLRVSKEEQDLRTQKQHCVAYMQLKDPRAQFEIYSDEMSSRKPIEKRTGFVSAMEALRRGDTLVSVRLDRICRSLYEATRIVARLDNIGAELILIEQPDVSNKILLGIYAGMAEEERKLISKRTKEKLHAKRERGERISRHPPYGYKFVDNLIEPDDDEQVVLNKMLTLHKRGLSYRKIVVELNNAGHRNRNNNPWKCMSVYEIIQRNPRWSNQEKTPCRIPQR